MKIKFISFFKISCVLSLFILNGCSLTRSPRSTIHNYTNYFYTPYILDGETIDTPVYIEVVLEEIDLDLHESYIIVELDNKIKKSFINELETIFINLVCEPEESEIRIKATVNRLEGGYRTSLINILPFVRVGLFLLGAPVFSAHGLAEVTVSANKTECNTLINKYSSSSKVRGFVGFYYGKEIFHPGHDSYVVYMASSKTMDEIKTKILNDRSMYTLK